MVEDKIKVVTLLTSEIKDLENQIKQLKTANEILKLNIQKKHLNLIQIEQS